jgi:hypothetical protein
MTTTAGRGLSGPESASPAERPRSYRIRLFDADRTDQQITFQEALSVELGVGQLLWIDAVAPMDEADAPEVA